MKVYARGLLAALHANYYHYWGKFCVSAATRE